MRPAPFAFAEPETVDDACAALARHADAAVLAGGQSLVAQLNARERRPGVVVSIGRIARLLAVTAEGATLRIGAAATQRAVEQHPDTPAVLRAALRCVGHVPTRNRGTVGGSIAFGDPAAELPAVLVALDGAVTLRSARGERTVRARDLYIGPFRTVLAPDELLTAITLPRTGRWAFAQRDFRRHGKVTAVAAYDGQQVTLGLGGVGDTPLVLGGAPDTLVAQAQARLVHRPDPYVSLDYRRRLTAAAVTAAIQAATQGVAA